MYFREQGKTNFYVSLLEFDFYVNDMHSMDEFGKEIVL